MDINIQGIIRDYLADNYDEALAEHIVCYFNIDQVVAFFVDEIFARDEDDLRDAFEEGEAQAILDHYDQHCI